MQLNSDFGYLIFDCLLSVAASTYADCFGKSLDGESSGIKDLVKVGLSRIVLGILGWRELGILEEENKD